MIIKVSIYATRPRQQTPFTMRQSHFMSVHVQIIFLRSRASMLKNCYCHVRTPRERTKIQVLLCSVKPCRACKLSLATARRLLYIQPAFICISCSIKFIPYIAFEDMNTRGNHNRIIWHGHPNRPHPLPKPLPIPGGAYNA